MKIGSPPNDPAPSSPELARPSHVRYRVLSAACALALVTYVHRVGFATALARLSGPLGLDDQHVGYLMAAFMVAYGLFEVPWGLLGDRLGVRHLLAIIVLGGSFATGAVVLVLLLPRVLAGVLGLLLVLRFLFGMFQAGTFPAVSRMLADWIPVTERGRAQGLLWMSTRLGGAVAPILVVTLFSRFESFGLWPPLVIVSGLGVLWVLGFWPWFRNRPEQMPAVNDKERATIAAGREAQLTSSHVRAPWSRMIRSRSVWSLCGMYGFMGVSSNFFITLLPTFLETHRHLSPEKAGRFTSLPFACGVLACLVGGSLSDVIIKRTGSRAWGRRLVGFCGLSIAALGIVSVPWVLDPALLAVVLCVTFVGNDLAMGPAWAAAADIGERYAGTLGGTMNMINSFVGALAAVVTGGLFRHHEITLPFVIFCAGYALGALCWLGVDVRKTLADD